MKVKFENCDVEVWRVRQGAVVMAAGRIGHISKIGFPKGGFVGLDNVLCIDVTAAGADVFTMTSGVTWLEPHD